MARTMPVLCPYCEACAIDLDACACPECGDVDEDDLIAGPSDDRDGW